jgi:hypothetical protein
VPRQTVGFTFAEVEREVEATKTVTMTMSTVVNGQAKDRDRVLVLAPSLVRSESDGGYAVTDFKSRRSLIVRVAEKRAMVLEGVALQAPERFNFYATTRDLARNPTKTLPPREIDGKPAIGFGVTLNGHSGTVWVDQRTKLPVRFELGNDDGKEVWTDIVFDAPLAASLFDLTPPAGYKVDTFGVSTLAPEPDDPALAAPIVMPRVGLGPARFGMTKEEVIKVLGKPDREFVQGKLTFLSYYSRGFELQIMPEDHRLHGFYHASCLGQYGFGVKLREFRGKTDKGIGLGASRADIEKAYGVSSRQYPARLKSGVGKDGHKPKVHSDQTQVFYDALGLSFSLINDKVYQIWIDAPRTAAGAKK